MTAKQKTIKTENHDLFSILMVCMGYFSYSIMDALSKWLIGEIPIAQITMTINSISTILLLGFILKLQGVNGLKSTHAHMHIIRVIFFIGVPYFILKSLSILSLTQFYSIIFTSPIIIMLSSVFLLNEKFETEKILMAVVGLVGVLVAIQADFIERIDGFMYCLIAVFLGVGNNLVLRRIRDVSHPLLFAFYPAIALSVIYAPFAIVSYVEPTATQWIILIISGIAVFGGQIGCTIGYAKASSTSTVAPYHYTQIIWGTLFGYFIFQNIPSVSTLIGIVLIIYSGLYIVLLQRQKQKELQKAI